MAYLILEKKKAARTAVVPEAAPVTQVENPKPVEPTPVEEKKSTEKAVATTPTPEVDESVRPDFPILSRAEWNAHAPIGEMKANVPSVITIHHTATPPAPDRGLATKLQNLQDFSQREGNMAGGRKKVAWPDVPYHFYIDVNGKVAEGREIKYVGDTNTDYDSSTHILIALEGNFDKAEPTTAQMETLFKMVTWLAKKYKIPADKISSHKAFAPTACPGKHLESKLEEIRQYAWKK